MSDANRTQMIPSDPNRTVMSGAPVFDPNKTVMGSVATINATVTIKPVQCPVCKSFNPVGVMFCVECGLIFDRALPGDAFGAPAVQLPVLVEQSGREYPIRPGVNSIGREGDISLADTRVSRRHASLSFDNDVLTLEDMGSTNGTKIDGTVLVLASKVTLKGGEKLSFGGLELMLQLPGAPGGNATQTFGGNKTAAISAAPKLEVAPATLVMGDQSFPLKMGVNSFGRKSENDVTISDPYVSGKHGLIEILEDGIFITDIGSTNGSMLNDTKLAANMRTAMQTTDVIRLGTIELTIRRA
jgi:pSer/pThr/pTyr-binding forkhead associated (FHA) protein